MKDEQLNELLAKPQFPRSAKYPGRWIIDNQMGLHALWLTEWLGQAIDLRPGMRVLDLACGKGLSSIFLAREFGVQVWAGDLWISATENRQRIDEAGVSESVFPLQLDARKLPFCEGFFDVIVCIDAYIYFGTDDLYLDYLYRFLKPGGTLAIAVPGFMQEVGDTLPKHLLPFWAQECWTWHTVGWWRRLWERTGLVRVEVADAMPDGCMLWRDWKQARRAAGDERPSVQTDIQVLEEDRGRYMGFVRVVARRVM